MIAFEARAVVAAEADPHDEKVLNVAESVVVEGALTRHEIRLLLEVIRRYMWDEGEI